METKENEYFDDILNQEEEPKPHIYNEYTETEPEVDEEVEEVGGPEKLHLSWAPIQELVSLAKMCDMLKSYYKNIVNIHKTTYMGGFNAYEDKMKHNEMQNLMAKYKEVSDFEEKVIEEMQRRIGDYEID